MRSQDDSYVSGTMLELPVGNNNNDYLLLPSDRLKSPEIGYQAERLEITYPLDYVFLPKSENLSSDNILNRFIASFIALFFRYSEQSNIPLTVAIGDLSETSFFPVNFTVSSTTSFGELVDQIKQYCHQTKTHNLSAEGSFTTQGNRVLLNWIGTLGVEINEHPIWQASHNNELDDFDLYIGCYREHKNLQLRFIYNRLIYSSARIQRLFEHWSNIMSRASNQDLVKQLDILSDREIKQLTKVSHLKSGQYASKPIHCEIEQHALNTPKKTAAIFCSQSLTYQQLNERSNRLAHWLLLKLSGEGKRVLVILEPGLAIPVVLMAIFKAGATYIPFDPEFPTFRLKQILEDTLPQVILTQASCVSKVPAGEYQVAIYETLENSLKDYPGKNLSLPVSLDLTAYIYYTSGTTGKPKGIMASHGNLVQYIYSANDTYRFSRNDTFTALARFTFSISMFELLSPLFAGGTLLLLKREKIVVPASLLETLQQVSVLHIGPSLLKGLLKYIFKHVKDFSVFDHLRHVSSGGDMIPPELIEKLRLVFRKAELYVIYGCSEISCMGTTWPIPAIGAIDKTLVGSAFVNMGVIVIDNDCNLVPIGVPGNVCFAGNGLVKGYLNRDELNKEKFFTWQKQRYYSTGDRGQMDEQGNLQLLGRLDFQIQLHGMRIELGELEYHLRNTIGVLDGVVICKQMIMDDPVLIAYFVADKDHLVSVNDIKQQMSERLPAYMIPTIYQELDELPLNQNLKVDRKALPDIVFARSDKGSLPSSEVEKYIAAWWCNRLAIEQVFLEDNFFDLGGDSLRAMDLIIDLEEKYKINLYSMDVIRESLQVLAGIISGESSQKDTRRDLTISEKNVRPILPMFFGDNKELFGVYHPVANLTEKSSVLICPPIGHENAHSYFFLRMLAEQLSQAGFSVFRFDYFGTGDSYGENTATSLSIWRENQYQAYLKLKELSACRQPIVIAARLGATLALTQPLLQKASRLILWDPIVDGNSYYQNMRSMHHDMLFNLFRIKGPFFSPKRRLSNQLLGFNFSKAAIKNLRLLNLTQSDFEGLEYLAWLACEKKYQQKKDYDEICGSSNSSRLVTLDASCQWYSTKDIGNNLYDQKIANGLIELVKESAK